MVENILIGGVSFQREKVVMDGWHYKNKYLNFIIRYYNHGYHVECYVMNCLNYSEFNPNIKTLNEAEEEYFRKIKRRISDVYEMSCKLNESILI